jgi:hypothetical protein
MADSEHVALVEDAQVLSDTEIDAHEIQKSEEWQKMFMETNVRFHVQLPSLINRVCLVEEGVGSLKVVLELVAHGGCNHQRKNYAGKQI